MRNSSAQWAKFQKESELSESELSESELSESELSESELLESEPWDFVLKIVVKMSYNAL